jgi:hypothetical protein
MPNTTTPGLLANCLTRATLLCLFALFTPALAQNDLYSTPTVVLEVAPVERVFVPQGFDDNDNVEVIIQGRFSNACMKTGTVEKMVDSSRKIIRLKPLAFVYKGEPCAQVIVPFIQRVTFGTLNEGTWKIEVEGMPSVAPLPLVVKRALSAAPDEFLYAPVEEVVLLPGALGTRQKLVVSGNWPVVPARGCFVMKQIRTHLGPDNTLVVQPISELLPPEQCSASSLRKRAFQASVYLEKSLQLDSLIHVRVLNGESLNKFYESL